MANISKCSNLRSRGFLILPVYPNLCAFQHKYFRVLLEFSSTNGEKKRCRRIHLSSMLFQIHLRNVHLLCKIQKNFFCDRYQIISQVFKKKNSRIEPRIQGFQETNQKNELAFILSLLFFNYSNYCKFQSHIDWSCALSSQNSQNLPFQALRFNSDATLEIQKDCTTAFLTPSINFLYVFMKILCLGC